jgi:hypothetical protein
MNLRGVFCGGAVLALVALCGADLRAQNPAEPAAYTVHSTNSMMGPTTTTVTYRQGSKAVVDSTTPAQVAGGAIRLHTYYDLDKGTSYTWDPGNDAAACSAGTFSDDWGDPYTGVDDLKKQGATEVGAETIHGFSTRILQESMGQAGTLKAWVDTKTSMIVKAAMTPPNGPPQTIVEVQSVDLAPPPAAVFVLPARCTSAPAPVAAALGRMPDVDQRIAEYSGGKPTDYEDAIYPSGVKGGSCTVVLRVVKAGSMEPVASGFQIALDMNIANEPAPHYQIGASGDGQTTFSGGGLHEVTAQIHNGVLRIQDPPEKFHVETSFGDAGESSSDLYRQCFGPETVLLFVIKNPANLVDGTEWLWVRSGPYAAAPQ